jgi:MFS family permease
LSTDAAAPAPESTRPPRLGPDYWRLWSAGTISNLGDGVDAAALPLLAASLTQDPRLVAGMATFAFLPWLLFALVAGAIVDRVDRRKLMVGVNLIRGVLVGLIAVLVATDSVHIWMLYVIAFGLGINETLFDNAAQSILPAIVVPELLERANGRQYAAELVANAFAGPPLGAFLFAAAASTPFWTDSASFIASAALIATIHGSFRAKPAAPKPTDAVEAPARPSIRSDIAEGIRWLRRQRVLLTLAILLGVMNLCAQMGFAVFVLFAQDVLGLGAVGFGLLLAGSAIGGVLGGLFGARIANALGSANALVLALGLTAVAQACIGLVSNAYIVAMLMWVFGLLGVVWNVITVSLRQRIIPPELLGRVNSVYRFLGWGSIPIGALLGGFVADAFGLRAPFIIGGVVQATALVLAIPRITPSAIAAAEASAPASA